LALAIGIFGASGSGKSTLMEALSAAGQQYSIHIKGTDRPPRQYDGIEIRCVSSVDQEEYDYIYQTYGYRYGLQRKQIVDSLRNGRHHFVICNDIGVIRALNRDFRRSFRTVFQVFDAPRESLRAIQLARGIADDEIELRLAKIDGLYRTFSEEYELFDAVLVNHYGDSPEQLRTQMEKLLAKFVAQESIAPENNVRQFLGHLREYLVGVADHTDNPVEQGYAFIMMAMSDDDPTLVDVHAAIKRACDDVGVRAERVDDTEFTGQITEKVLSSIRVSEFVIADLTHERPNVYYEIGYANALNKPLVLVARRGTKPHFDVQGMRVLYYDNLVKLEDSLRKVIPTIRSRARASDLSHLSE
jgi:guanylate kinase